MTYDELGSLLECSPGQARERVLEKGLDRKKSRDGKTRVKLCLPWIELFVARIRAADEPLDRAIADLRRTHATMKSLEAYQEPSAVPKSARFLGFGS